MHDGLTPPALAPQYRNPLKRPVWFLTRHEGSRRDLCPELSGSRCERRQPLNLQVRASAEDIDPRRREVREINLVTAPIGTAAIVVGKSVVASKFPGAEEHSGAVLHLRVRRERGDRASDEQR